MRFALLFLFCVATLAVPAAILVPLFFIGPAPYAWDGAPQALDTTYADGSRVVIEVLADADAADDRAARLRDAVSAHASRTTKSLYDFSYRSDEPAEVHGRIVPIFTAVLHVTAPGADLLEQRLKHVPGLIDRSGENPGMRLFRNHLLAVILGILLYVIALVPAWARVGSWAATINPEPGAKPAAPEVVADQIRAMGADNGPFRVFEKTGDLIVEWKYVDATWAELMARAGLRMMHRIRLRIDGDEKVVRALDTSTSVAWRVEAGLTSAQAHWRVSVFRGISFIDVRAGKQYGLLVKDGRLVFDEAYSYQFDVDEMKGPLIDIALGNGYRFKPVLSLWRWLGG